MIYAPPLSVTSDAALVFYGASVLLAAGHLRLATPPRRPGRLPVFSPIDQLEGRWRQPRLSNGQSRSGDVNASAGVGEPRISHLSTST